MRTKISLHIGQGIESSKNADALVVPVDTMLNPKAFKVSKALAYQDGNTLGARLNTLRRVFSYNTGFVEYPETFCIPIKPELLNIGTFLVTVSPSQQKSANSQARVEALYKQYTQVYASAVSLGCKTIVSPVIALSDKSYTKEEVFLSLLLALSDLTKQPYSINEVCFVVSKGEEEDAALKWLGSMTLTFGLGYWYQRNDLDFHKDSSTLVYEHV